MHLGTEQPDFERCYSESAVGWNLSSSTWHVQRTLVPLSRRLKLQYCFVASLDENFANYPEVTICSEKNSLKVFPWREKEEEEVENQKTFFFHDRPKPSVRNFDPDWIQ